MAKLARKTQKIFAGSAQNNGVFGSLQDGNKRLSNDVEVIQSLPAFSEGWNAATVSSELLPPLEEFQGLQYMQTAQLAYVFQEGLPEWDAGTTYYKGGMVKYWDADENMCLAYSLIDDNVNHNPLGDDTNWKTWYNSSSNFILTSDIAQTLENPSEDTVPSTKVVSDEISRIINIMSSSRVGFPNYTSGLTGITPVSPLVLTAPYPCYVYTSCSAPYNGFWTKVLINDVVIQDDLRTSHTNMDMWFRSFILDKGDVLRLENNTYWGCYLSIKN